MRELLKTVGSAQAGASSDEGFRQELMEESLFAAAVIGSIQVILAVAAEALDVARPHGSWWGMAAPAGMLLLGVATCVSSTQPRCYAWVRSIAVGSFWVSSVILAFAAPPGLEVPAITAMLLSVAALMPLTLRQAVASFTPVAAMHFVAPLSAVDGWLLVVVAIAGVTIAVAHSVHRWSLYTAHLQLVQSTQDLRLVQARALSAEHAASLERLAAAVSHELNTPVGALRSAVDTLQQLREKYLTASAARRERLDGLYQEVLGNLVVAAARIQEIVGRLQRFSSLDRATVRQTDMNLLLRDAVAMIEAGQNPHVEIVLDLQPVPLIVCETQAWNTIFVTLVTNALGHCAPGSLLCLTSTHRDGEIAVDITVPFSERSPTTGMDPGFVAEGGRVGTANWTLFHVRMWIQQQGGDLRQASDPERGLMTRVTIPAGDGLGLRGEMPHQLAAESVGAVNPPRL